jgi:hypothetical protein
MSFLGGTVTGMIVADAMGAVPTKQAVPATTNAAKAKTDVAGKPVSSSATPRQTLWMSAAIVVGALGVLVFGSNVLKDARIG